MTMCRSTTLPILCLILTACGGTGDGSGDAAPDRSPSASVMTDTEGLEGTWRSGEVTIQDLYAAGRSLGLSRSETRAEFWGPLSELPLTFQVAIQDGRWFQTQVNEGGVEEFGWDGTYEVVDETTVVATDPCGSITYRYELEGDILTVDMLEGKNECAGAGGQGVGELLAQTLIYESTPFTRVD